MSEEKNKKKTITTIIIVAVVVVLTGVAVMSIKASKNKKGGMGPGGFGGFGGFGGPGQNVTSVKTVTAKLCNLQDYVTTNGEVETQTAIEVFPSIGGKVVQMNVSLGSAVKKGDVIAYIDPSSAGSYYVNSPVTAPISGSIISSPVKTGQQVSVSSIITRIGDIDNLQITAKVPERFVGDLELGQKADIMLEAYPDLKIPASVVRISPVVDPATRTKEIILNFEQNDPRINAGMFAKVKLYTRIYGGEIAVQQDALVNVGDDYFLYVVGPEDTVEKRLVTLGRSIDGIRQILSGISVGETVVVEGMLTLSDGSKIKDIGKSQE